MIQALIGPVASLLDKFIPDATEKQRLAAEIATMAERQAHEIALAQIDVNKEEAKSQSWFVSAWRPAVGWVCVIGLCWHFIGQPIALFFISVSGANIPPLPQFEMDTLMTLLFGLLGMGALRTVEKTKGVAREKI
jgi:phenylpyruvate tautomerase PptA (4-oxalocrotonate tautomerase family)